MNLQIHYVFVLANCRSGLAQIRCVITINFKAGFQWAPLDFLRFFDIFSSLNKNNSDLCNVFCLWLQTNTYGFPNLTNDGCIASNFIGRYPRKLYAYTKSFIRPDRNLPLFCVYKIIVSKTGHWEVAPYESDIFNLKSHLKSNRAMSRLKIKSNQLGQRLMKYKYHV